MHRLIENIPYPIEPTTIPTTNPTNFIYTNNYCTKDDRKINIKARILNFIFKSFF